MYILRLLSFLCCCCCFLLVVVESKTPTISEACRKQANISIGVVIDERSRVGKEQKIAMNLAVQNLHHCLNLKLHIKDSHGNSASAAIDLVSHNQVDAIIGTLTLQEVALLSQLKRATTSIPTISLSPAASAPKETTPKSRFFIQISTPITFQMQGIAAIVGHFRWRKVMLIHEQCQSCSQDSQLFTHLSYSLRAVDSSIEYHSTIPCVTSLLDPNQFIEEELRKIRSMHVRVYVVAQSSLEFAVVLFDKAKKLGMMEKGYVWIVSDEIVNLLDSVDLSVILNMQGVVGLRTDYSETSEYFGEFKSLFRRKYASKYPAEEENSSPSIYSLRGYDAIWTLVNALQNSDGKIDSNQLVDHILSSNFQGLSGKISFKNGLLSQEPVFRVVNVIGKSYREVALWSPEFGFLHDFVGSGLTGELSSIYWPGGEQIVPKGWSMGSNEKPLRIGVPAKGAFKQFVNVSDGQITGFSIEVFAAAVKKLPYDLYYTFVPYYGSYDEMVAEVHNKSLDAAVGDTEIMAFRYAYAEFTQPYIESGLVMVVTVKPGLKDSRFIALNPFTKQMWLQFAAVSMSTGAIIWLSEYATGNEQFIQNSFLEIIGSILWFSVTIISFSQRENINDGASKLVLAAWICVVFVVGASFTAVLSSMMTVPRLEPSIQTLDYLLNTNAAVGCNRNSFIVPYLINVLHVKPENIQEINSIQEYPQAFENGLIKAAFFVAPHAKVFLSEYCHGYTISGPSYKLGGFGFVFQKGSPLAIDISEAVLQITQNGTVNTLEKNMLYRSNCTSSTTSQEAEDIRLGPGPFSGMLQVLCGILLLVFCIAIIRLVRMKWTSIRDWILHALMHRRSYMWASLVVTESWKRFRSRFFTKQVVVVHAEMEPNLVAIEMAANHT